MSPIDVKSPKHCEEKGFKVENLFPKKKLFFCFSTISLSILSFIFLLYLTLHPTKPNFTLREADIYQLNLSGPRQLLNSSIQLTLVSKNPNKKVGIYYDELQVFASYKGQQITLHTSLPPFYQGHEDSNFLSALLIGNGLPVDPYFGYEVQRDQSVGKLIMNLKGSGRLRWKVGTWVSGKYRFNVDCVAIMPFGSSLPSAPLSFRQGAQCSTTL
ncbi:protein YLS9 [Solanum tuberosum]|uniref:NDR1/HIN1 n=1 Tax=Solanum tuberosum TaxID=4113 RepID=M0ZIQ2_SOLTU|nr:PREDICTED: protein YLS9 [Solanum tuberosum]